MFSGKTVSNPDNLHDLILHYSQQYKEFMACKLQDILQEKYAVISHKIMQKKMLNSDYSYS